MSGRIQTAARDQHRKKWKCFGAPGASFFNSWGGRTSRLRFVKQDKARYTLHFVFENRAAPARIFWMDLSAHYPTTLFSMAVKDRLVVLSTNFTIPIPAKLFLYPIVFTIFFVINEF
jgi:hypothetical protein